MEHPAVNGEKMKVKLKEKGKMPKDEWKYAYLAGMLDGEGTINLYSHREAFEKMRPHLFVTNNSKEVIDWLKENFGGILQKHGNGFRWGLWSVKDVLKILEKVSPYLIIKRSNAIKVKEYCLKNINSHQQ